MRTIIFAHKGVIGAETDMENGIFLNNPKSTGQLGAVVPVEEIDITQEAIDILKAANRENGSFASIMLTKHSDQSSGSKASIGLLGFGKHLFLGDNLCIGRECDTSILDMCNIIKFESPFEFVEVVDSLESEGNI